MHWDPARQIMDPSSLQGIDTIVHLAGTGIADQRWTKRRKQEILDSRVQSTALLFETLRAVPNKVKALVSASAIGYYEMSLDSKQFTEENEPGSDFLADVVVRWEREADKLSELGLRVVKIRTGIVFSVAGGALPKITQPIKWGVGAPLGTGRQYMSWIHEDDLCGIFAKAIEDETLHGAYNAVSPNPATNRDVTYAIAGAIHRRIFLPPVPSLLLKGALGEMANMILMGNNVSCGKIQRTGYSFVHPTLEGALTHLLGSPSDTHR